MCYSKDMKNMSQNEWIAVVVGVVLVALAFTVFTPFLSGVPRPPVQDDQPSQEEIEAMIQAAIEAEIDSAGEPQVEFEVTDLEEVNPEE